MKGSRFLRAEVFPILASACLFLALGAGFSCLKGTPRWNSSRRW